MDRTIIITDFEQEECAMAILDSNEIGYEHSDDNIFIVDAEQFEEARNVLQDNGIEVQF